MKYTILTIVAFSTIILVTPVWAGGSSSSFKLSVTLPAVIGLNVAAPQAETAADKKESSDVQLVQQERTVRDNQDVIVKSITIK